MLLGATVSISDPLGGAEAVGAEVVQVHLSAPRVWRPPIRRPEAEELASSGRLQAAHAPYLCNPASGDPDVRRKTRDNLQATLDEAAHCGVGGVVVHAGHAAGGGTMEQARARWVEVAGDLTSEVPLWIENTASGETAPGRRLEDVAALFETLDEADLDVPVGACFDTCHAWAGDPEAAADPDGYVRAFAETTGGIDLLHVNDSRDEAGAGRDRHANLGEGRMGAETLAGMVAAAVDLEVPAAIVETPSDGGGQERDLRRLRSWVRGTRLP